ncbi:heavy metal translocating P-type ATPase [Columbia Basin potato purple top phytoplasma]|uniref:Heavy metal translocating P-type ATPase n=1 Tax=Columbia Basin potato purple top phytoplasma TaxID=307134 RepID=A0ABT5L7X9_9MOLU|nr:heavy metal translocating P-type ATPase [Columbia Basin potato purple top phytoplasma]MDC9031798.1 heavy metal translocating P-type ATPase [Columbia Basin potato purple top phytoplasma]
MNNNSKEKESENPKKFIYLFFVGLLIYFVIFIPINFVPNLISDNNNITNYIKKFLTFFILFFTGYSVIKEGLIETYKNTKKNKKLTPNVHILMILAAVGSLYQENYNEAVLLIIIFGGAHFLEEYVEEKNQKEIKKLLDIKPKKAKLLQKNNDFKLVDVCDLKIGDKVMILNGEQIPSDGIIISGNSSIDESTITGESMPLDKTVGDKVFGSNINLTNTLIIEITTTEDKTIFSKIIKLTQQIQENVSKKASFIQKLEPLYVKAVLLITFFFVIITQLIYIVLQHYDNSNFAYLSQHLEFSKIFYKSMVFLTVSSPCALAVADIPATLSAISNLAQKGILLKNGQSLSVLSNVETIVFDKTGTLTKGKIKVQEIFFKSNISDETKNEYLNILWTIEKNSNHPIAFAIQKHLKEKLNLNFNLKLKTLNLIGIGIEATDEKNNLYKVAKYNIFDKVPLEIEKKTQEFLKKGNTVVYLSHNNEIIMSIAIIDIIRTEAKELIEYFNNKKINTVMLTGDNETVAEDISSKLNLNYFLSNCLPETKFQYIEKIKKQNHIVAMVGDGINDSPALANSDVSITLQEGSDAVIDIADIILIKNDLKKIVYAHKISYKLNKIIWQNIVFAFLIIVIFSLINFIWKISLPIAVIAHEGSTLLVIFNCLRLRNNIK